MRQSTETWVLNGQGRHWFPCLHTPDRHLTSSQLTNKFRKSKYIIIFTHTDRESWLSLSLLTEVMAAVQAVVQACRLSDNLQTLNCPFPVLLQANIAKSYHRFATYPLTMPPVVPRLIYSAAVTSPP